MFLFFWLFDLKFSNSFVFNHFFRGMMFLFVSKIQFLPNFNFIDCLLFGAMISATDPGTANLDINSMPSISFIATMIYIFLN